MKRIKSLFTIFMTVVLLVCNINIIYASDSSIRITPQESMDKSRIIINEIYNLNDVQVTVDTIRVLYDVEINPTYLYIQFKGKGYAIVSRANTELIVYDIGCEKNPLDNISYNEMIVYGGGFSFISMREIV